MSRRRGAALVGVLMTLLVLGMLATAMMSRTRGSRRKLVSVRARLQRDLAMDAAVSHAFHRLKDVLVDREHPLSTAPIAAGSGTLAGVPYRFHAIGDPTTRTVRIEASAGEEGGPTRTGFAVAAVHLEEVAGGAVVQRWTLHHEGRGGSEARAH